MIARSMNLVAGIPRRWLPTIPLPTLRYPISPLQAHKTTMQSSVIVKEVAEEEPAKLLR